MGGIMEAAQNAGKTGDLSAMTKLAGKKPKLELMLVARVAPHNFSRCTFIESKRV
jgi:hypothetical protein